MRFDLKRIEPAVILSHLENVCNKEDFVYEKDGLGLIARVADGSMRDALSLLDQAIALSYAETTDNKPIITTHTVQKMLGTTDRQHLFTLVDFLFKGDVVSVLEHIQKLFHDGADPLLLAQEVLDVFYWLTCIKTHPSLINDPTWPLFDRDQGRALCEDLPLSALIRFWQMLSKGYEEIQKNPLQRQALQMVCVRMCYATTLPPIENLFNTSQEATRQTVGSAGQSSTKHIPSATSTVSQEKSAPIAPITPLNINTADDLVSLLKEKKEVFLAELLIRDVHILDVHEPHLIIAVDQQKNGSIPGQLRTFLKNTTGNDWIVTVSSDLTKGTTLADQHQEKIKEHLQDALIDPFIASFMRTFPESAKDKDNAWTKSNDETSPTNAKKNGRYAKKS
jgi:DNA polymerase-3 subunit gamma/tau